MIREEFLELFFKEEIGVRCANIEEVAICKDVFGAIGIFPCKEPIYDVSLWGTGAWPVFVFANSGYLNHTETCTEIYKGEVLQVYEESFGIRWLSVKDFILTIANTEPDFSDKISMFLFGE